MRQHWVRRCAAAFAVSVATSLLMIAGPGAADPAAASARGGSITRAEVLARAASWWSIDPHYCEETQPDCAAAGAPWTLGPNDSLAYRPDCSGFVSMAWHLTSSLTTATLPSVSHAIAFSDLRPGDILDHPHDHTVLFVGWADRAHTTFNYYSESAVGVDMHHAGLGGNVAPATLSSYQGQGYTAYRYNLIADDAPAGSAAVYDPTYGNAEVYYNSGGSLRETYHTTGGWVYASTPLDTGVVGTPAAIWDSGHSAIEVFYNRNGELYQSLHTSAGWVAPKDLGIAISGSPAVIVDPGAGGNVEVYFNGAGTLHEAYYDTTWRYGTFTGALTGRPSVVWDPSCYCAEVFANSGGHVTEWWHSASGWTGPQSVNGYATAGEPTAVYDPTVDRVDVFFPTSTGLSQVRYDSGWSLVISWNDIVTGTVEAAANLASGNLEIYYNTGGRLVERYHNVGAWSTQGNLATISSTPAPVYDTEYNNFEVYFANGTAVQEMYFDGAWEGPNTLPGGSTGAPFN